MARKKSGGDGGGNAILVVFLVFFILVSIGLGVVVWTDQAKITDALAKEKAAKDKENAANDTAEAAVLKMKLYRVFVYGGEDNDRESIQKPGRHAEALKEEHAKLIGVANDVTKTGEAGKAIARAVDDVRKGPDGKPIEQGGNGPFGVRPQDFFTWPWPASPDGSLAPTPSPGPLLDRMVKLVAERERMFYDSAAARKTADTQGEGYKKQRDEYASSLADLNKKVDEQIKKLNDSLTAVETEKKNAIDTFQKEGDTARKQVGAMARERDDKVTELQAERDKLVGVSNQLKSAQEQLERIKEQEKGIYPVNLPHGSIVRRDLKSNTVEIDLGSDAGLSPGQAFTVQPATARTQGLARSKDGKNRIVSKGAIEVVEVLGPRLSTARITEEADAIRDGILKGDLLYNPSFRKNAKDHVVLVGIFDTNADGQDDITEVARTLTKRGLVVDGFFDLSSGKWESLDPNNRKPGPTPTTKFVIHGWEFDDQAAADAGLLAAKGRLRGAVSNAISEAKSKGVREVRAEQYFPEIGYPFSPSITGETTAAAAVKYLKDPAPAPAPTPK